MVQKPDRCGAEVSCCRDGREHLGPLPHRRCAGRPRAKGGNRAVCIGTRRELHLHTWHHEARASTGDPEQRSDPRQRKLARAAAALGTGRCRGCSSSEPHTSPWLAHLIVVSADRCGSVGRSVDVIPTAGVVSTEASVRVSAQGCALRATVEVPRRHPTKYGNSSVAE